MVTKRETRNRLSADWASAGARCKATKRETRNRLSADWGSAGAISGPPQLKSLKN